MNEKVATGDADWDNSHDDDYDDGMEPECLICGGDGFMLGGAIHGYDYGWLDRDKLYPCPSCGGTGRARDMRYY